LSHRFATTISTFNLHICAASGIKNTVKEKIRRIFISMKMKIALATTIILDSACTVQSKIPFYSFAKPVAMPKSIPHEQKIVL
jgi:hypothetical protein